MAYRRKHPKYTRDRHYRQTYGITETTYNDILKAQNGVCGVCGVKPGSKPLVVDHNHRNGKVRGLLCDKCNRGLGFLGDNLPVLIKRLSKYYKSSRSLARRSLNDPVSQAKIKAQANKLYQ